MRIWVSAPSAGTWASRCDLETRNSAGTSMIARCCGAISPTASPAEKVIPHRGYCAAEHSCFYEGASWISQGAPLLFLCLEGHTMPTKTPALESVITRREYMRRNRGRGSGTGPVPRAQNHRDYYAQFITESTLSFIQNRVDLSMLKRAAAEDPVNLISAVMPTQQWHLLCSGVRQPDYARNVGEPLVPLNEEIWALASGHTSFAPSEMICVAKEAALMILERDH